MRSNLSGSSRGQSFEFAVSNVTSKGGNSLDYSKTAEDLSDVGINTAQQPAAKSYDRQVQEQQLSNLFLEQQKFRQRQHQEQQQQKHATAGLSATVSDGSADLEEQLTMSDGLTDELLDSDLGMTTANTGIVSASETSDSIYMDASDMRAKRDSANSLDRSNDRWTIA